MKLSQLSPLFFLVKFFTFLVVFLYFTAFALSGTNIYGEIDYLIPYERIMLFFVGMINLLLLIRATRFFIIDNFGMREQNENKTKNI